LNDPNEDCNHSEATNKKKNSTGSSRSGKKGNMVATDSMLQKNGNVNPKQIEEVKQDKTIVTRSIK
jgi:hypothetical protein